MDEEIDEKEKQELDRIVQERQRLEALLLVTHRPIAKNYPTHFIHKNFQVYDPSRNIQLGEATHLNLRDRTYQILTPTIE